MMLFVGPQALPTFLKTIACRKGVYPNLIVHSPKYPQGQLMDATNPPIYQQSPPVIPLGFEPVTPALIPLVGPQVLSTLLKSIACRKCAYPNLIVHSPKRSRRTQGELMDTVNPPIYQHF